MTTKKQTIEETRRGQGCLGKSADDEIVFVLCARDACAPDTVRDWALRASRAGAGAAKVGQAMLDAVGMERWQKKHGRKVPD